MLVALLVCLIPTTIGALLSAIGIAGMDRLVQRNVLAMSGRAVEAAGDCATLLLDKTGTITLGNRQAAEFIPRARRAPRTSSPTPRCSSSLADETPEGRSIVVLAEEQLRAARARARRTPTLVPFTAQTRMSGVDIDGRCDAQGRGRLRAPLGRGAGRRRARASSTTIVDGIAGRRRHAARRRGRHRACLGVIHLKDIVKQGMRERFDELRAHGHPHRDDHRRQPAHRGRDRRRGRRRRLPRRGDARRQDGA